MKFIFATIVGIMITAQAESAVRVPMWSNVSGSSEWNEAIKESLLGENKELLDAKPRDAYRFCPNFENLKQDERILFWTHLVSALAEKESSFKPRLRYKEGFKDRDGTWVISRGLLQLSKNSSQSYDCDVDSGSDLEDAETNLECGLTIMKRWILNDNVIAGGKKGAWRGLARYWGPFRTKKLASIKANIRAAEFCKK